MNYEDHNILVGIDCSGATCFDGWPRSLPLEVRDWLGFRDDMGHYGASDSVNALVCDNDHGMSFAELAEKFRNPPEGLLA